MAKLLLIDDDIEVLKLNKRYLETQGFTVYATNIAEKAVPFIKKQPPDCILLDVMMPNLNGYCICKKIRSISNIPIIFLSGLGSEDERIKGLMLGAEDYIVKPYSLKELKLRIDALLRRSKSNAIQISNTQLIFSDLKIDKMTHKAYFLSKDLQLANREYEVLLYLAEHPNQEITFHALGQSLFGTYQDTDRSSLMVIVSRLRKKLGEYPEIENIIKTIWSVGYLFQI